MRLTEALHVFLISLRGAKSPRTESWYGYKLRSLVTFLGDVAVHAVTVHHLRQWRASLGECPERFRAHPFRSAEPGGLSQWSIHGHVRAARRFFRWLTEEGIIERNPAARLELPRLPPDVRRGIDEADVRRIVEAARASSPRDYALVRFLADTACRVGGVVNLRIGDLALEAGWATVREKGEKSRIVFLRSRTVAALRAWLKARPDCRTDHVFTGHRGRLTASGIYQIMQRLAAAAGVASGWNPHNWRHGAARRMLMDGANLAQVSQLLGHADVSVTVRFYGTFASAELQEAHRRHAWEPEDAPGGQEQDS